MCGTKGDYLIIDRIDRPAYEEREKESKTIPFLYPYLHPPPLYNTPPLLPRTKDHNAE